VQRTKKHALSLDICFCLCVWIFLMKCDVCLNCCFFTTMFIVEGNFSMINPGAGSIWRLAWVVVNLGYGLLCEYVFMLCFLLRLRCLVLWWWTSFYCLVGGEIVSLLLQIDPGVFVSPSCCGLGTYIYSRTHLDTPSLLIMGDGFDRSLAFIGSHQVFVQNVNIVELILLCLVSLW